MAESSSWAARYRALFESALGRHGPGSTPANLLQPEELAFLESIGSTAREFFDLVEDRARGAGWDAETVLLLTATRRDYFLRHDGGRRRSPLSSETLPPKSAELKGIRWLPRIIEKAKRKLQGTMDESLMFGCGGDAGFCERNQVNLVDFLHVVLDHWEDEQAILDWVRAQSHRRE